MSWMRDLHQGGVLDTRLRGQGETSAHLRLVSHQEVLLQGAEAFELLGGGHQRVGNAWLECGMAGVFDQLE